MSDAKIVLYRCPTPTDVLCPCGAVARRLGRLGLEYRTARMPYRRARRPEIEELTRQRRIPVLVDGDEVIHDSKRILQYLDWKYANRGADEAPKAEPSVAGGDRESRPPRLYNVKQWRRRKKQSS
jgi:glutathione S-transferase